MSSGRKVARPVRQLSLQQQIPRRQQIRRQRSAEDGDKSLHNYTNPIGSRLVGSERPKVRVAWADCRDDNVEKVEVVARQIPSQFRPIADHRSGNRSYIAVAEKASILYSRQKLAERLRLAWKHREENKANIDIFLAHGLAVKDRCDSQLSASVPPTPIPKKKSDSFSQDREKILSRNAEAIEEPKDEALERSENDSSENPGARTRGIDSKESQAATSRIVENNLAVGKGDENTADTVAKEETEEHVTDPDIEEKRKTRISIDCTNLHSAHPAIILSSAKAENIAAARETSDDFSSARQKRTSFHSGTNRAFLVPTIENPTRGTPSVETNKCLATDRLVSTKSVEARSASVDKTAAQRQMMTGMKAPTIDKNAAKGPSVTSEKIRTNSAPPQRRIGSIVPAATRVQVNIVIDTHDFGKATNDKLTGRRSRDGKDFVEKSNEGLTKISRERTIRSAPLKRRSRSARRRFLVSSEATGRGEDRCEGRGKISADSRITADVITMVSLISSADSDSDVENSPGDDKLINELRNKLPTTPIIKSINPNPCIARKPIKSVSFQRDSFDEEPMKELMQISAKEEKRIVQPTRLDPVANNHEDTASWRQQDIPGGDAIPLAVSTLIIEKTEKVTTEAAQLTDREKRCLAVPIGNLHDDKKRKLLRTRSTPSRLLVLEQTNNNNNNNNNNGRIETKEEKPHLVAGSSPQIDGPPPKVERYAKKILVAKEISPREIKVTSEPSFQTTKEKECWHLYRRMCDKGVCVSFDTILRGMLTPTEYRLRQKELSQDLR